MINLKTRIDSKFPNILNCGEITLGVVQKILNLYLKYQWSLGNIPEPPNCPFDRIIIEKLKIKPTPSWTTLNCPKDYLYLVERAKDIAGKKSIAQWELEAFSRRSN